MKKSNIVTLIITVTDTTEMLQVTYFSGKKVTYDLKETDTLPTTVFEFMRDNLDKVITTVLRTGAKEITYSAENTYNKALEMTRAYTDVFFGGIRIRVDHILKSFLSRDDVNVVYSTNSDSYKVFYNGHRHHVYTNSVLYRAILAANLIVEKI